MNTLPTDLYKLIEFGLGGYSWQEFIDNYNEKYNNVQVDGFEFNPMSLNYTFKQLIANLNANTLPAYVDPESPGYEAALHELEGASGDIPTQKKYYRINRVILRNQLQLLQQVGASALNERMQNIFMGLLDEGTDGLIGSYYNALAHQRMRIVSTGKFTINTENNPRGLKGIDIDFKIPASHFDVLTTTARWWTTDEHTTANEGSKADPIAYLRGKVKEIRRTFHYLGKLRMELAQDLLDDMLTHSKVLTQIGYSLYPTSATADAAKAAVQYVSDEQKIDVLRKLIKVDEIVPRDSYAFVDKPGTGADGLPDLVTERVENFKATNIAFIPVGQIGTIQGVEPITLGYDADKVANYSEGRLKLTQRAEPKTHSLYIESEAAQLCVPSVPQYMFISTVTA